MYYEVEFEQARIISAFAPDLLIDGGRITTAQTSNILRLADEQKGELHYSPYCSVKMRFRFRTSAVTAIA
jgi:hypothetical protein